MAELLKRHVCEVIAILLLLVFFGSRNLSDPWDRSISGDGKGYYAYLPALFIYQDLEYNFVEDYEAKYYPEDRSLFKEFRYKYKGESVNKTFPGITVLWLPFFLIAHFLSFLLGFSTDGYSLLYQYSIGIAAIFYVWLGCKLLLRILHDFEFDRKWSVLILFSLLFGTNLFYYTVYESSLTHAYNFFLITGFCWFAYQSLHHFSRKSVVLAIIFLGMIVAVRPPNGLALFILPFLAGNFQVLKAFFLQLFKDRSTLLYTIGAGLAVIAIPISMWYAQTGYFYVYSYGEEGFDFSNPEIFNSLFSYRKGWFVYTPIAFLSMIGFIELFRTQRFRLFSLGTFLFIIIYVFSSWWCWWYGAGFGQRAYVDYYVLIGLLLAFSFRWLEKWKYPKYAFSTILTLFIGLNLVQSYQHLKGILPGDNITKEIYWENFLSFKKKARLYLPNDRIVSKKSFKNNMEQDIGWGNYKTISAEKAYSGKQACKIDKHAQFGITFKSTVHPYITTSDSWVRVSAMVHSNSPYPVTKMIIEFKSGDEVLAYSAFGIKEYVTKNKWVMVQFGAEVPELKTEADQVIVYYWNPSTKETVRIDDMKVEFISLSE
jgi:hypothetical protein